MSYVTLLQAKQHLAVFQDEDDALIQDCIDAAEAYCAGYMNREAIADEQFRPWFVGWGMPQNSSEQFNPVPKSVVQAVKLTLADFYENRVPENARYNSTVIALLDQQRVGLGA